MTEATQFGAVRDELIRRLRGCKNGHEAMLVAKRLGVALLQRPVNTEYRELRTVDYGPLRYGR